MDSNQLEKYFSGLALYGDDFDQDALEKWYREEKEAYANLGSKNLNAYTYIYHALNKYHGYRYLPQKEFSNVLGFGSAYGEEFKPIAQKIKALTIVDPSDVLKKDTVEGIPITYIKPGRHGRLTFPDQSFDLITCLSTLHHIPNVTFVMHELYRCLQQDGFLLLREPIFSMGDWRKPRSGLTKNERGIPLLLLRTMIQNTGFHIIKERICYFPLIPRFFGLFKIKVYNSYGLTIIDYFISQILKWNLTYHAKNQFKKLRPTAVFYVLTKKSVK
jgi:SAM-dependent methyltransferase